MTSEPLLEVKDVSLSFGGLRALGGCNFVVHAGTVSGLIGPNGAGKSSLINVVSGAVRPSSGSVYFRGEDITLLSPLQRARRGIIRTYQIPREFGALTVLENLLVVHPNRFGERLFDAVFARRRTRTEERVLVVRASEILDMFGLYELRNETASNLSGGAKRLLELARAVMVQPSLLMLDEPMAGVAPALL
ncbi:MAG: ABC transporter ATP-binding protein, partial [Acidimicrobiales bacterium]